MGWQKGKSREETYGDTKVLDDKAVPEPCRELWAGVIFQAILNINYRVEGWQEDFRFLSGKGSFSWICEQLGYDERKTSISATTVAMGEKIKFAKRR